MAFEIAGAVIGGEILAAGMTDVAIGALADAAVAGIGDAALGGLLSTGAQEMAGWGIADAAAGGATNTAVGSVAAETVGAGPAATAVGTQAAESTTQSLAKGMIDADSILAPTGSGAGGAATQAAETAMTQGAAAADKGILGNAMDFVKTPAGAMVAGQTAAGMLSGAGGAIGATRAAQIKAENDQKLLRERAEIDRQQSISGTYNGQAMPTPVAGSILRYASNGQPVYGLVGSRLPRAS